MSTDDVIGRIVARHGLEGEPTALPAMGMVNEAWRVGEHVVRINRDADDITETEREIAAAAHVATAGILTPVLVAADVSRAFVPRGYTVYRRAEGVLLAELDREPAALEPTYRALGRELARVAAVDLAAIDPASAIRLHETGDARGAVERAIEAGRVDAGEVAELRRWLDELAAEVDRAPPSRTVFLHHDLHPWNLLVDPGTGELTAIIDWGNACTGDPAIELQSMPLVALPAILDGYRDAGGVTDAGFMVRALWAGIQLAGWELRELDPVRFDRRWWRQPLGGWREHREVAARLLAI